MPQPFRKYLRQLQERNSHSVREFAEQLGVNPTHISRAMGSNSRPFDIKGLFKLARVTGEHPSNVLRAAGKGDLADLIEEHFGEPRPMPPLPTYSPSLKIAIQLWERIEAHGPEGQRLLNIVTDLLREADRTLALQRRLSLPKSNGNLRPARARRA